VDPREVFSAALAARARGVVLAHNHPSGDVKPSEDDVALTRRAVEAGELLGISVLDHLVVGAGRYLSMAERGLL
jgi:DNA repair protein RadC